MELKLKFIFNTARPRSDRPSRLFRVCCVLILFLTLALALPVPVRAQQSLSASNVEQNPPSQPDPVAALADPPADESTQSMFPHFKSTRFWLTGQANFIFQTHPDFHAPYSGAHSLDPNYEKATSR